MYTNTFYSFKGGVGRTLALVNAAIELVNRGKRVLIVDFDLEAPGLGSFSLLQPPKATLGLVDYVTEFLESGKSPDIRNYVYESKLDGELKGQLWVMPAGRSDGGYANRLSAISWQDLYEKHDGYLMFEDIKHQWKQELNPDYVLIDSRTGHTDVGGICTRQLPDSVSIFFLPNKQNLEGLTKVVHDIKSESPNPAGKTIQLNFVMSNVPDIDDEEQILERWTNSFSSQLGYHGPALIIHHYASLSLLDQVVFTSTRPRTKLAIEYRALVNELVRNNPEDRAGVLDFLGDVNRRAEQAATQLGISAKDLEERLENIRSIHSLDGEILYRLATIRHRQGRIPEALALVTRSIECGYEYSWAFMRLSDLASITGDNNTARVYIEKALNSTDLNYFQANRAIRTLWALDPATLETVADSPAVISLDVEDQLQLAIDLSWSKEALTVSEKLLRRLLALGLQAKDVPDAVRLFQFHLGFCLIGLKKYRSAMEIIGSPRADLENAKVPAIFNFAMAEWAESNVVPVDLFNHICVLERRSQFRPDANYKQCLAIAFWACNQNDIAIEYLRKSREAIRLRPEPTISALRYLKVTPPEFLSDLDLLENLITRGSLTCPLGMRADSGQENLFLQM